jgi:hypothetical protein
VNDSAGPEGLTPTLLVFVSLPRPARKVPAAKQIERAKAVEKARDDIAKEYAERRLNFSLRYRGPYGGEREDLRNLPYGAPLAIYREGKGWKGPVKCLAIESDTVTIETKRGRKLFRSSVVKPWVVGKSSREEEDNFRDEDEEMSTKVMFALMGDENFAYVASGQSIFSESRRQEIEGLMASKMFKVVAKLDVPSGSRIYNTSWVDTLKNNTKGMTEKSRLVAQNYRDQGAASMPTKAPTVSRVAQRIAVALEASLPIRFVRGS